MITPDFPRSLWCKKVKNFFPEILDFLNWVSKGPGIFSGGSKNAVGGRRVGVRDLWSEWLHIYLSLGFLCQLLFD